MPLLGLLVAHHSNQQPNWLSTHVHLVKPHPPPGFPFHPPGLFSEWETRVSLSAFPEGGVQLAKLGPLPLANTVPSSPSPWGLQFGTEPWDGVRGGVLPPSALPAAGGAAGLVDSCQEDVVPFITSLICN